MFLIIYNLFYFLCFIFIVYIFFNTKPFMLKELFVLTILYQCSTLPILRFAVIVIMFYALYDTPRFSKENFKKGDNK